MQGIQVEPGISQFLRLCANRIAIRRNPISSAVLAHSLRFIVALNQNLVILIVYFAQPAHVACNFRRPRVFSTSEATILMPASGRQYNCDILVAVTLLIGR
jgi:hypothetical protein